MKRFFGFLGMIAVSLNCFVCSAFAGTTLVISSAQPDSDKSFVLVNGSISGVNDGQQITSMVTEVKDGTYDEENICYINQTVYTDSDGAFSFQLGVKGTLDANKAYIVRIGGDGVDEPVSLIVGTDAGGKVDFVIGDANNDGVITSADSSLVLQYVLDPESVDEKYTSVEKFKEKINVTGKDEITAEQASYILARALDSSFEFPVSKK